MQKHLLISIFTIKLQNITHFFYNKLYSPPKKINFRWHRAKFLPGPSHSAPKTGTAAEWDLLHFPPLSGASAPPNKKFFFYFCLLDFYSLAPPGGGAVQQIHKGQLSTSTPSEEIKKNIRKKRYVKK